MFVKKKVGAHFKYVAVTEIQQVQVPSGLCYEMKLADNTLYKHFCTVDESQKLFARIEKGGVVVGNA